MEMNDGDYRRGVFRGWGKYSTVVVANDQLKIVLRLAHHDFTGTGCVLEFRKWGNIG